MLKSLFVALIAAAVALILPAAPAKADLKEILDKGTIRIGVIVENPPFGSIDGSGNPVGYDVDIAKMVAEAMGLKLDMVQLAAANRIPYLLTGKIDIIIASLAGSPERALQVMLTTPYAVNQLAVFGAPDVKVASPADIGSNRIAVVKGALDDTILTAIAKRAEIMRFDTDTLKNAAFFSGQAELWGGVNTQMAALLQAQPGFKVEEKFTLKRYSLHMAVRQGDFQLLQWLNTFIMLKLDDGTLPKLFQTHFHIPLANVPVL